MRLASTTRSICGNPLSIWPVETEGYTLIAQKRSEKQDFPRKLKATLKKWLDSRGELFLHHQVARNLDKQLAKKLLFLIGS